jgi:hypothetical protein
VALADEKKIGLWDWSNGHNRGILAEPCDRITALEFSCDGTLASGDSRGAIKLWDIGLLRPANTHREMARQAETAQPAGEGPAGPSSRTGPAAVGGSANPQPKASAATPETARSGQPSPQSAAEWTTIFNGESLDGWKAIGSAQWFAIDRCIAAQGARSYLVFRPEGPPLRDFEIRADININPAGNSGLFVRCDPNAPAEGYEVQIAGSSADNEYCTGSIWGKKAIPGPDPTLDNAWFKIHVTVLGSRIVVQINGRTVMDYSDTRHPEGYVALQHWTSETRVRFANVQIKPIVDTTSPKSSAPVDTMGMPPPAPPVPSPSPRTNGS